jgi:hypothetical protein
MYHFALQCIPHPMTLQYPAEARYTNGYCGSPISRQINNSSQIWQPPNRVRVACCRVEFCALSAAEID